MSDDSERLEKGEYQYTTIDYNHPDPRYRSRNYVAVHLQTDVEEIVAGASIEVSDGAC